MVVISAALGYTDGPATSTLDWRGDMLVASPMYRINLIDVLASDQTMLTTNIKHSYWCCHGLIRG